MLEKTLEGPLDCKRSFQSILKGIKLEYSLGRTAAEAETGILGHLMRSPDSLEKTLMLGKIEGERRSG